MPKKIKHLITQDTTRPRVVVEPMTASKHGTNCAEAWCSNLKTDISVNVKAS